MSNRILSASPTELATIPLRFAVLGTGYWSTLQIPAWLELGGVDLVACYNRTFSRAEAVAARFGIPRVYADAEEMLLKEQLDFIDIIAEVPAHAPLVLLAAKHRTPVICQKPMGTDYQTCQGMVNACRAAGIPFFIHENYRWQPPLRAVRQALDEGHLDRPFRAELHLSNGGPDTYINQPFLKTLSHCALTDMGSHVFDVARFYFGEAQSIYVQTHRATPGLTGEDTFVAQLRFSNLICTCAVSEFSDTRVFIEGHNGSMELKADNTLTIRTREHTITRNTSEWPHHSWVSPEDEAFHGGDCIHSIYMCNQHLLHALRTRSLPETSGEDNLRTAELVFAGIQSAESGEIVHIENAVTPMVRAV